MSIDPKFFKGYHLSDIAQGEILKNKKRVFRGYGSDTTDKTDNIIYIATPALDRMVALKAFMESYKLNLTKETDIKKEADKSSHAYTEYTSDLGYDLTLNIPAHSTNESRNNIAKLEELQRLISPNGSGVGDINAFFGTKNNYFVVWFKNLIHSGVKYSSYPTPRSITMEKMMTHGFFCYIDGINYEPDMNAGFFEFDGGYLFPKNIKLNLSLKYGVEFTEDMADRIEEEGGKSIARPLHAFSKSGHYSTGDNGRFPFGLLTLTSQNQQFMETVSGNKPDFTTTNMNKMDYRLEGNGGTPKNSFLFMSLQVPDDKLPHGTVVDANSQRKRWIKFKGFIQSFNRDYKVNVPLNDGDKDRLLGKPMDFSRETTFESLDYSIKIDVPSFDIAEAKKNCAKLQYLMRMFFKKYTPGLLTQIQKDDTKYSKHALKVYSPSFIESPLASKHYTNSFDRMYKNSLDLFLLDVNLDINIEAGFFEENGYLWPKSFSLDMKMAYMSGDLIKNYAKTNTGYKMLSESDGADGTTYIYKGKEHLFPFPRQTSKIKIGGE